MTKWDLSQIHKMTGSTFENQLLSSIIDRAKKEKSHDYIDRGRKKHLAKIQLSVIKTLNWSRRELSQVDKTVYKKSTANIILNGEKLKVLRQECPFRHFFQYRTEVLANVVRQEKGWYSHFGRQFGGFS